MLKIISNLFWISKSEQLKIEMAKLEHELKVKGRALSVSTGESDNYWEAKL